MSREITEVVTQANEKMLKIKGLGGMNESNDITLYTYSIPQIRKCQGDWAMGRKESSDTAGEDVEW